MLTHLDNFWLSFFHLRNIIFTDYRWLQDWLLVWVNLVREGILRLESGQRILMRIDLLDDFRLEYLHWDLNDWERWPSLYSRLGFSVWFSSPLLWWLFWIFCGWLWVSSLLVKSWVFDIFLFAVSPLSDKWIAYRIRVNFDEFLKLGRGYTGLVGADFALVLAWAESHLGDIRAVLRVCVIVKLHFWGAQRLTLLKSLA